MSPEKSLRLSCTYANVEIGYWCRFRVLMIFFYIVIRERKREIHREMSQNITNERYGIVIY